MVLLLNVDINIYRIADQKQRKSVIVIAILPLLFTTPLSADILHFIRFIGLLHFYYIMRVISKPLCKCSRQIFFSVCAAFASLCIQISAPNSNRILCSFMFVFFSLLFHISNAYCHKAA